MEHHDTTEDQSYHPRRSSRPRSQKRLLLQILDALTQLNDGEFDEPGDTIRSESRPDEPPVVQPNSKEQWKIKGSKKFQAFRTQIQDLDKELERLTQNFRQLGSAGIISSSVQLRTRLAKVLFLFNLNASTLFFPYVTVDYPPDTIPGWKLRSDPKELELLADDLMAFLNCLHEFPALTHEPLDKRVLQFSQALKHWAVSLQEFQGDVRNPVAAQYLHHLCGELEFYLTHITTNIGSFIEQVVPVIRVAQQRVETTFVSLSGLAAFVSAVTATGIQITHDQTEGPLKISVNAFWFTSLVFSVASAVNSLLGLAWTQSRYRSPQGRVPWWILIWLKQSPLIFLISALIAFSIGLVLFTWSSGQHLITCLLTTIFTGISLFSLSVVSIWFALERAVFVRSKGERLLADVFVERRALWMEHMHSHIVLPIKGLTPENMDQ